MESLTNIFLSGGFIPHGHCYLWKSELLWLHITSDSLIALAYYSIPITLIYFVRKRDDLPYPLIFLLFGAFIVACGTTHLMEIWTLWHPTYWLSGLIKAITAIISLYTATALIPLVPKLLALPSPEQLKQVNQHLEVAVAERTDQLVTANASLQQNILELQAAENALATVMKASQAIGTEIELDKLLSKLMTILIDNAGAQTGFLILERAGEWVIEAAGTVNTGSVTVLQSLPLANRVATSLIDYVIKTQEKVVETDAFGHGNFTKDSYIDANQTKSLLCIPLLNQGELSGIVYLENNLTTGAFTTERLEVLQMLSGQAAIAITNARLYAEVRENERRLKQFLEAMPVGIAIHNSKGEVEYLNQIAKQLTKFEEIPEAKTEQLAQVYSVRRARTEELDPTEEMPVMRSLQGETVKVDDVELHHSDRTVPLEVSSSPIFDEKGKIKYVIATFQDITKRKQVQKILENYNRTLENQVSERTQELKNALATLQAAQQELIQSEKMAALGQLIANIAHEINTPLGAIKSSINNIASAFDSTSKLLPRLLSELSPQQQVDFFALVSATTRNSSTLTFREERKLKRAYRNQLENHQIEDVDFISTKLVEMGFSQEIEPFIPLLENSHSNLIIDAAYNLAIQLADSENIQLAVEKASKIIFALKSYTRQRQGEEKVRASVTEGIELVLTIYYNQIKQGVTVQKNYRDVPDILCYPEELNQVWTNLIHNALQAMNNQGQLEINVAQEEDNIVVKITDSGCGIPEEIQDKIFQPFFTTKAVGEGSGLGLDIVSKIIAKHQGKIKVESVPGQTSFMIFLPVFL